MSIEIHLISVKDMHSVGFSSLRHGLPAVLARSRHCMLPRWMAVEHTTTKQVVHRIQARSKSPGTDSAEAMEKAPRRPSQLSTNQSSDAPRGIDVSTREERRLSPIARHHPPKKREHRCARRSIPTPVAWIS